MVYGMVEVTSTVFKSFNAKNPVNHSAEIYFFLTFIYCLVDYYTYRKTHLDASRYINLKTI